VCVPDVIGALVVWIQNQKKKNQSAPEPHDFSFSAGTGEANQDHDSTGGAKYVYNVEWRKRFQ